MLMLQIEKENLGVDLECEKCFNNSEGVAEFLICEVLLVSD